MWQRSVAVSDSSASSWHGGGERDPPCVGPGGVEGVVGVLEYPVVGDVDAASARRCEVDQGLVVAAVETAAAEILPRVGACLQTVGGPADFAEGNDGIAARTVAAGQAG